MKQISKAAMACLVPAVLLSACATIDNSPKKNTLQGAGVGAGIGAVAGIVLGDDKKDIALGTAAGAVIGGLVGNSLDQQESALRQSISSQNATITNTGSELIVTLPDGITFDSGSSYVSDGYRPEINKIANNLRQYPDTTVDVVGHTDSSGSEEYNQSLSADRAHSVSTVLTAQGVSASRVVSYGRGETTPVASNETEEGKARNRRVEIIIRPTTAS